MTPPPKGKSALAKSTDSSQTIATRLRNLRDEGDLMGLRQALSSLSRELGVPLEHFSGYLGSAEEEARQIRTKLGKGLKAISEETGCDFEFRPPFITFGAITIRERELATYDISVLDGVVVDTVSTTSASTLARAALDRIEHIEAMLKRGKAAVEDLMDVMSRLKTSVDPSPHVCPNLLMILCMQGKGWKKSLAFGDPAAGGPLSRAAMGYLLKACQDACKGSGTALRFKAATQNVTKDPSRYLSVPHVVDPRRKTQGGPIAEVYLTVEERVNA